MNFNKCERCGCFYTTDDAVCPKCMPKEIFEMGKLKEYLSENNHTTSLDSITINTGISSKNVNRFLGCSDFSSYLRNLNSPSNINMNLD